MSKQVDLMSLSAKLDLNTAAFSKGMKQANKSLDRMDRNMKKTSGAISRMGGALKGMAAGIAASFTVGAIKNFVASTIEAADRVDKLSQVAGLSAESFQRLEHAAGLSGLSADKFSKGMETMSRRIGNARAEVGPMHSALTKLNPELLESVKNAKNNEEAFYLIVDAMDAATTQAEKAAIAMASFGGSAGEMTILAKGGSEAVKQLGKDITVLSGVNTKVAAEMNDKWNTFWGNFSAGAQNMAVDFIHSLSVMGKAQADFTNAQTNKEMDRVLNLMKSYRDKLADDSWATRFATNTSGLERSIKNLAEQYGELAQLKHDNAAFDAQAYENMTRTSEAADDWFDKQFAINEELDKTMVAGEKVALVVEKIAPSGGGGISRATAGFEKMKVAVESVTEVIIEQQEELTFWEEKMVSSLDRFAAGFADTLVDGIMSGKIAFQDFAHSFLVEISKMIAQQIILNALQKTLGGIPGLGFLGGLSAAPSYAGAFASGGTIPSGSFGLVGERGAELVRGPATVTSASDTAAAMAQPQNIRIINSIDPGVMESYLGSDSGERIIMNLLGRNKASIRNLALS